jgi:hypothetical protein
LGAAAAQPGQRIHSRSYRQCIEMHHIDRCTELIDIRYKATRRMVLARQYSAMFTLERVLSPVVVTHG